MLDKPSNEVDQTPENFTGRIGYICLWLDNGPNFWSKIPNEQGCFEKYVANCNSYEWCPFTNEELRNVFFFLEN